MTNTDNIYSINYCYGLLADNKISNQPLIKFDKTMNSYCLIRDISFSMIVDSEINIYIIKYDIPSKEYITIAHKFLKSNEWHNKIVMYI
jgi:hypothetical protein